MFFVMFWVLYGIVAFVFVFCFVCLFVFGRRVARFSRDIVSNVDIAVD